LRPTKHKWDYRDDYQTEYNEKHMDDKNFIPKKITDFKHDGTHKRKRFHQSFMAHEVKMVMDELNIDFSGYQDHSLNGGEKVLSLGYSAFIPPIVKAIQEQQEQINDLIKELKT
jgi:hypothetical protein